MYLVVCCSIYTTGSTVQRARRIHVSDQENQLLPRFNTDRSVGDIVPPLDPNKKRVGHGSNNNDATHCSVPFCNTPSNFWNERVNDLRGF